MLWGASSEFGSFLAIGAWQGLDRAVWFGARSAGLVAYALATCSVLLGLVTATWTRDRNPSRGTIYDTHRALALLTVLVIAGHVLLLAFDRYARFGPSDLLVPFASWYRPVWTGLGVLAAYVLLAVYASFYVRSRIGYRTWRALHYATFAVFVFATVHGLRTGSDSGALWAKWLYTGAIIAVASAVAYRLLQIAGPQPVWARERRAGDLGEARVARVASPTQVAAMGASSLKPRAIRWVPSGGGENGRDGSEETAPP